MWSLLTDNEACYPEIRRHIEIVNYAFTNLNYVLRKRENTVLGCKVIAIPYKEENIT